MNPIERVWQHIKQELSWEIYENLDEIQEKVRAFIEDFSMETIASITGWDYILSALNTVALFWRNGIKTGLDGRKYCIRAFNQNKKPGFFGTDASWTGSAALFGAPTTNM